MTQWWMGIPPAETRIRCGDHEHRLRWSEGALDLLDHGDVEGERTLAALARERNACVETADRWQRHAQNPRVLILASRGPTDQLQVPEEEMVGAYSSGGFAMAST